jgi:hypothetical protein
MIHRREPTSFRSGNFRFERREENQQSRGKGRENKNISYTSKNERSS